MLYLLWEDPQGVVRRVSYMFDLGNDLNRGRRLRRGSKFVGHNIRRVRYLEVMGDVVPHWREGCA